MNILISLFTSWAQAQDMDPTPASSSTEDKTAKPAQPSEIQNPTEAAQQKMQTSKKALDMTCEGRNHNGAWRGLWVTTSTAETAQTETTTTQTPILEQGH